MTAVYTRKRRCNSQKRVCFNAGMSELGMFLRVFFGVLFRRLRHGPRLPAWGFGFELANEVLREDLLTSYRADPAVTRRRQDALASKIPLRQKVIRRREAPGGVPVTWFTPHAIAGRGEAESPVLLYLHGGGYVLCSVHTHADFVATLAEKSGVRVALAEYRLAPEHPHPAALDDAAAVYAELLRRGVPPERIVVGGDSAGGGLTLALFLRLRAHGLPLPAGGLLISPWVDLGCSFPSVEKNAAYDFGTREILLHWASLYRGGLPASEPLISPLHADLAGLPPLCVIAGTAELLADEVDALVKKARLAGVAVDFVFEEDMTHIFPILYLLARPAAQALAQAARFVAEISSARG
jgi:acetyl esterase/lipase